MYAEKDIINHNNVNLCKILLLHKILLSYSVFIHYHLCLFIVTNLTSYFAHCVKCREEMNCSNKGIGLDIFRLVNKSCSVLFFSFSFQVFLCSSTQAIVPLGPFWLNASGEQKYLCEYLSLCL